MCGLFGWFATETVSADGPVFARDRIAIALAIFNDRRGGDSWGYYDGSGVTRGLGAATDAVGSWLGPLRTAPILLGHTRMATTGARTIDNAHPFTVGPIIGAHNGMISNHHSLNQTYQRKCEVDSQHIFEHLASGLPLNDISAYGAITYVDTRESDRGLYLGRFHAGVLALVLTEIGFVWSSDKGHLLSAVRASGLKVQQTFTLKAGRRYRLTATGLTKAGSLPFKDYTSVSYASISQRYGSFEWDDEPDVRAYAKAGRTETPGDADRTPDTSTTPRGELVVRGKDRPIWRGSDAGLRRFAPAVPRTEGRIVATSDLPDWYRRQPNVLAARKGD